MSFASSSFLVISLAVSAAAQVITTPPTPVSYPWNYSFPPVGLAYSETLQINVVNRPVTFSYISTILKTLTSPTTPTTSNLPTTSTCTGTITFTNAAGTIIGTPVQFIIPIGTVFSAPLPFSMTGYSGFRGEIQAAVQGTTTLPSSNLCSLSVSLETFDTNTGVTHTFLSAPEAVSPALLEGNFYAVP
jgi:hypothetical protein